MTNNYNEWLKHVSKKPTWLFEECRNVGKYMIQPVEIDEKGKTYQAKSKNCYSSKEAVEFIKHLEILYTILLIEIAPPINPTVKVNLRKRHRAYLVRGVW